MEKTLRSIIFTFENQDAIEVDADSIGSFLITDISKMFTRYLSSFEENSVASTVFIEISPEANVTFKTKQLGTITRDEERELVFNRLSSCMDIVEIKLVDLFGKETSILPKWVGFSDNYNDAQEVYVNEFGHLFVMISESLEKLCKVIGCEVVQDDGEKSDEEIYKETMESIMNKLDGIDTWPWTTQ